MAAAKSHLLLVCATVMEMRAVLAPLPGGLEAAKRLAPFEDGVLPQPGAPLPVLELPAHRLLLLPCGVGPVAPAYALGMALAGQLHCSAASSSDGPAATILAGVLNLGLAGTYDPGRARLGSLVLADAESLPEYGLWTEGVHADKSGTAEMNESGAPLAPGPMTFPQAMAGGKAIFRDMPLDPLPALAAMDLDHQGLLANARVVLAPSATVAGISADPGRATRMAALSGAVVENMEGFSLALACRCAGVAFAEVRAVSNLAGRRPPEGWDLEGSLTALGRAATLLFGLPDNGRL